MPLFSNIQHIVICNTVTYNIQYGIFKEVEELALFNTNAFRVTEQGLSVLWQKQQVISQNIANQDTPDYNCKYLDFYAVLKDRMESTSVMGGKVKPGQKEVHLVTRVYEDDDTNTQPDGNNVDVDSQSAELAKVQLQYTALKNQMNGEFTRLRSAMKTT